MKKNFFLALFTVLIISCSPAIKDYTKDEKNVCEIHKVKMKKQVVLIRYGLIKPQFPESVFVKYVANANFHKLGGCIYEKGMPRQAKVYYCPVCRANHKKLEKAGYNKKLKAELSKLEKSGKNYNEKQIELDFAKKILEK